MTIFHFIKKECFHILRDKRTLLILFGMPVIMIVLFGYAIRNDLGSSKLVIVDNAHDTYSQQLTDRLDASKYFEVSYQLNTIEQIDQVFRKEKASIALVIPSQFGHTLMHAGSAQLLLIADGSDPNTATSRIQYAQAIIQSCQQDMQVAGPQGLHIHTDIRMLYNPELKSVYGFIPGLMALILMLISAMMTAITITKEKETGTMELLLVSPLKPVLIITGKIVPYILLSFINALLILGFGHFLFDVPILGNTTLLLLESIIFILTALSLGILISTLTSSQQTAMMISLGGLLMPTVLLSGFIFPLSSMPWPLRWIANLIPAKWFILILKDIMLKGSGWRQVWEETLILLVMTTLFTGLSIQKFKIRLDK